MFQPKTSSFNPLTIPYLPDTYFPYTKRPLNQRPYNAEIDTQIQQVKRQRIGSSPIEHKELAAIKKLERETLKNQSNVCNSHKTMINMPLHILKYLQSQGATLNRTNEAMEILSAQVTDLTDKLESAIKRFSQPVAHPTQNPRAVTPNPTLLTSYYSIIVQTLQKFKSFREAPMNRSYSTQLQTTQSSSAYKYDTIRATLDCISKIRDLIMFHCNFDCCNDEQNASIMWPVIPGNITLVGDSMKVTWDTVHALLLRMETNLRKYMECIGIFTRPAINTSTQISNTTSMTHTPTRVPPHPIYTSTPVKGPLSLSETTRKRKECEDGKESDSFNSGTRSHYEVDMRKKLRMRKISFSCDRGDRMEVD